MSPSRRRAIGAVRSFASRRPPPGPIAAPHRPGRLATAVRGLASRSRCRAHHARAPLLEHTRKISLILHHDGDTGDLENRVDGERVPYNFLNLYRWVHISLYFLMKNERIKSVMR